MTKEETPLRYGDTILLTQMGSMLGSYYTSEAVSNTFMMPMDNRGMPEELSCVKTCGCFRIMPPYEYESLEELKEELMRKKLNWNRILELENNHKREEKDNQKRLNRYIGRVVRYDHTIQLFHLYSGKILTASPKRTSHTEARNFACYLDCDPSKHSRFKILPAVDGYDPGDPVNHSDFVNLYSDPDGFIETSLRDLDPVSTLYPPLREAFIGPKGGGFSIKLYKELTQSKHFSQVSETSLTQNTLLGGDLVQFYNKSLNMFLEMDGEGQLVLRKAENLNSKHMSFAASGYWVVENVKAKYSCPIQISSGGGTAQDVSLTNYVTGKKAVFPSKLDHVSLKSLIKIKSLDIKSGDCVKMFSGKSWLSFGPVMEGATRRVVCTDHRDHTDVLTVHKIDVNTRQRLFKLLGYKLLLKVVHARCEGGQCNTRHTDQIIGAVQEIHNYLENVKKKIEVYESCMSMGITRLCFSIAHLLLPRMGEDLGFKRTVEWLVVLIRGMVKHTHSYLGEQGLELARALALSDSGLEAFLNVIRDNVKLVSVVSSDITERLVQDYITSGTAIYLKVLRKLCKCKKQAVTSNQNIIIKALFSKGGPASPTPRMLRIQHSSGGQVSVQVKGKWVPAGDLSETTNREVFREWLGQLELIRNLLYGRNLLGKEIIVGSLKMFSETECVDIITNEEIDVQIRSTYIKILIAAHIDHVTREPSFEPRMLSYQHKKAMEKKDQVRDMYAVLEKWLLKYVENNTHVVTAQEEVNQFKNSVIMLVQYMFRKEELTMSTIQLERYIKALVKWLDGTLDKYYEEDTDENSLKVFRTIFRFRNLPENMKCNVIKQRVLETLHLAFWHCLTHFWMKVMGPLHSALHDITGGNEQKMLQINISSAVQGVIPLMSLPEAVSEVVHGEGLDGNVSSTFTEFLEDILSDIYLFSETPDIMEVVLDTLNYEADYLTTRSTELMVLLFSPIHKLLGVLPKTRIMVAEDSLWVRNEITNNFLTIKRLSTDPFTEELLDSVITSLNSLRDSCLNDDHSINRTMQKFVFDLGTVQEIIRIVLANRTTISSMFLPTDANIFVSQKLLNLKIESFRLLKVVISGLEQGQEHVMEFFKEILEVRDVEEIDAEGKLEQAKAFALDEIFTDNTNLSLNVKEDEILAVFQLIMESVMAAPDQINKKARHSHLYLAIIENMIDMEDSTDFLCKHQTYVLRLIREFWTELNGRLIGEDGTLSELHLLNVDQVSLGGNGTADSLLHLNKEDLLSNSRSWQGLYFTQMISLMACCVVGDAKSTETICKEQYQLRTVFPLLRAARNDITYFTCLSKFVLNVYIKSISVVERQQLLGKDLAWYINEGVTLVERVTKNLRNCTTTQKMSYLNVLGDLGTQIKLLGSRDDVDPVLKDLVCYYDYIFFVLCPIVTNVFSSDRDLVEATIRDVDRFNIVKQLCKFAKFVSPFLSSMLWTLLFEAIEAVNTLNIHDLSDFYFSDKDNRMYQFEEGTGVLQAVEKPVQFNKEINDVMDLMLKKTGYKLKEAYTKKIMRENKECNMNDAFQTVVSALIQITETEKEGKSVKISEELKSLGIIMFDEVAKSSDDKLINFAPFCDDSEDDYDTHEPVAQLSKIIAKIENGYCSDYTAIRLINVFAVLAEDSNRTRDHLPVELVEMMRKEKFKVANSPASSLLQMGLTEALGSLMTTCDNDNIQQAVTQCMLSLLQIPSTKSRLREYCLTNDEPLFEWCADNIVAAIEGNSQLCMIQAMRDRAGIEGSLEDIGIVSSTPIIRLSVQLVGAMCDGQYTEMQNYLRLQDNKLTSHNFLVMLIRLLHCVRSGELLIDTMRSVNSLISANDAAKETAIENDIVEILNSIVAAEAPANDYRNAQEIKSNCYSLLSTLVEQSNMLKEFYEKIREELDIRTLQSEINSHLGLLGSEGGEQAQTAAFKGYALLKKISSLEKRDYVGKLDDEISQKLKVGSVEIQWKGHLEKVYYPMPRSGGVRNKIKEEMKWGLDRKSKFDKQRDFLLWSSEIVDDMMHQRFFTAIPLLHWVMKRELWWDWLVFLLAAFMQLWLLREWVDMAYATNQANNANEPLPRHIEKCIEETGVNETYTGVCPSEGFYFCLICMGIVHMIACIFLGISYFVANYHRISLRFNPIKKMAINWNAFYHFYLLALLICSGLGIWSDGVMYCFHLFHIATLFDLLRRVIQGATIHADQLLVCIPFAVIITYIYAIIYFSYFREMFNPEKMEYCETLGQCLVTVLKNSLRPSSGGHNYSWTNRTSFKDLWTRLLIDASFWILFTIIGLNVVTSLILDGFRQLKAERERALKDMKTLCTVCGLSKDHLTSNGISWASHVDRDHNMWSYITFFFYLQEHTGKFSAVENEVLQKFNKADPSFLPNGRCIAIDTKLDLESTNGT